MWQLGECIILLRRTLNMQQALDLHEDVCELCKDDFECEQGDQLRERVYELRVRAVKVSDHVLKDLAEGVPDLLLP
jgi:hypothetical protein